MAYRLFIFIMAWFFGVCLSQAKEAVSIPGIPARSFYLEVVPKESKVLKFNTVDRKFLCNDRLDLKSFESTKLYPSTDNNKPTTVKIINLYVHKLLTGCMQKGQSKNLSAIYETPKGNQMVHVYVTTDDDIQITF